MDAVQRDISRVLLKRVYEQGLISEGTYSSTLEKVSIVVDCDTPSRYNGLLQKDSPENSNNDREGNGYGCTQGQS
ncbi:MAG TPA: hypothetical protein VHO66_08335 [Ruminiclostridium sp.]|jgi:hypothetical protein|nr:hypothetical protein [Ruminiclostridium sp.]